MSSEKYIEGTSYSAFLNGNYSIKKKMKVGVFSDYSKANRYTASSVDYFFLTLLFHIIQLISFI